MTEKCTPCQENAVLRVGDAICHRINASGKRVNCHGLIHDVKSKKLSLRDYVRTLDDAASSPKEKEFLKKLREYADG